MSYLDEIKAATLLLDSAICKRNIKRMKQKADYHGLKLTPHLKTAQSRIIGKWVKDAGIDEITVSSLSMANYLKSLDWKIIHVAFPFNIRELDFLKKLASDFSISVQIVNEITATHLADTIERDLGFFIEIDAGYGRAGVNASDTDRIEAILRICAKNKSMRFRGFYIHPGHSYYLNVRQVYDETISAMAFLKLKYRPFYPECVIRCGDTPGASMMDDFGCIDELSPGNFMFYDLMQVEIGSCVREDIAIALAAPVVDIDKAKSTILVHGGGVHLSKESLRSNGRVHFGEAVVLHENGWQIPKQKISWVSKISQEHGTIQADDELLESVEVGSLLGVLPVHSCLTGDCMRGYLTLDGDWIDHAEGAQN